LGGTYVLPNIYIEGRIKLNTKNIHQDVFISIVIFLSLGFLFMVSLNIKGDSGLFPRLVIGGLALLNTVLLFRGLMKTKEANANNREVENTINLETIKWPLIVLAVSVVYVAIFNFTNFFVASTVFLIGLMKLYKMKSWKTIILVTLAFNIFIYLGFVLALNVPLI